MATFTKQQIKELVAKAPKGTTPEGIVAALRESGHTLEGYPTPAQEPGGFQKALQTGVSLLPAAMGTAGEYGGAALGGLLGAAAGAPTGPGELATIPAGIYGGRVAGASAGAATGKFLQNALGPAVGLPQAPLGEGVGKEALIQGGMTAVGVPVFSRVKGLGALAVAPKIGRGAMEIAGKLTPEAAQVAIREGIAATGAGAQKLMGKLGEAGKFTERLYRAATLRGVRFNPADIAHAAEQSVAPDLLARGLKPNAPELQALTKARDDFIRRYKGAVNPEEMKKLVQYADEQAQPIYRKIDNMMSMTNTPEEIKFWKAIADEGRLRLRALPDQATRRIGRVAVSHGVREAEAHTQSLVMLKNELVDAVKDQPSAMARILRSRAGTAGTGALVGAAMNPQNRYAGAAEGAAAGYGANLALNNPTVLSHLAMLLNDPRLSMAVGQLLRPAGSALNQ